MESSGCLGCPGCQELCQIFFKGAHLLCQQQLEPHRPSEIPEITTLGIFKNLHNNKRMLLMNRIPELPVICSKDSFCPIHFQIVQAQNARNLILEIPM